MADGLARGGVGDGEGGVRLAGGPAAGDIGEAAVQAGVGEGGGVEGQRSWRRLLAVAGDCGAIPAGGTSEGGGGGRRIVCAADGSGGRIVQELGEGGGARGLDRLGHHVGEVAGDAGAALEQGVDQALVGVDVAGDDVEQVVDAAAQRPGGGDGVEAGDRRLEGVEVGRGVAGELDGDEDLDVGGDLRQRDLGAVAADDAGVLEALQPLPERGGGQVDLAGEVGLGERPSVARTARIFRSRSSSLSIRCG